ncbi:uncharacterized protein LOC129585661 [Paramacrobiotus metropolitanus]|uniref:uncharacterized protein LOC129585661 n=1 Tax=Paramacrobiotus metropolitanus TaxID=2943436 RepID=UPI00244640B8|nr:uncharacterized protein LOC129585661 [Paramacrobiotus metropolitanus]
MQIAAPIFVGAAFLLFTISCASSDNLFDYQTYDKRRLTSAENLDLADSLLLLQNLLAENKKSKAGGLFAGDNFNTKRAPDFSLSRSGRLDLGFGRSHSGSQIASFTSANQNALSPEGPGRKRR